jgi:sugar-specific transcriptional regulator TrmB
LSRTVGEEAKKTLHELGLTAYETAVYLSLVERGVMTASDVSDSANVPFSKVYEVLNCLERKGWIDVERGRPSRYFAKAPSEALEATRRGFEERMQGWTRTFEEELQPLYEKRELREKPDVWILRGEASVLAKLQEMLGKAHREVMVAAPIFVRGLAEKALPLLVSLRMVDVKVLLMVADELENWELERLGSTVEIRRRSNLFGGGVIVDGEEALLFLGEEDRPSLVIWSNHVGLVKFAKDYFRYLWESA